MTNCILAATGFDTWPWMLAAALFAIGAGSAWLLLRRGRRRSALFAAAPLLVLALLASGLGAPTASFAAAAPAALASSASGSSAPGSAPASAPANDGSGCSTPVPAPLPTVPAPTPTPTPTPTPPPVDYRPGAAGIGDPYYPLDGNGGYDVQDYDLQLAYDPASGVLSGEATITAVALENLSTFNLDFDTRDVDGTDAIAISAIQVDGSAADWNLSSTQISDVTGQPQQEGSTDGDATPPRTELTVIPAAGIRTGATISTTVSYSGVPITIADAFGPAGVFRSDDGAVIVGQPRVAATWFPANDHPSDKATMTTRMTVPAGLQVIGNGRLVSQTDEGSDTIWEWRMDQPMATYLATATVGDYQITTADEAGITYYDAIDPELYQREADPDNFPGVMVGDVAASIFASEPEVIDYLQDYFGPYPFTEAGGIAIGELSPGEDLPYALENQTRPIYPAWAFPGDSDPAVVVHELAHQWYGDSVAMHRWSDIWLNEGFATYAEWLWAEGHGGLTTQQQFDAYYADPPGGDDDAFWETQVADPGSAGIFDSPVYYRGAMTLQALRTEVGDTAFFAIVKGWATENAGTSASTADFIDYAETVSGQNLGDFFETWLYTPEKPAP